MKRALLVIVLALWTVSSANAQKIKYKDLYLLLEAKKFDEAEPFLKRFLSNPKNADHPNANFQMAMMFQAKSYRNDVLRDDSTLVVNVDSALLYYDRTLKFITEKEVRRNDEYYRAYQRRDIRTGKYAIKLTDVQFDIEKKQKALLSRKEKVKELSGYYESTIEGYNKSFQLFEDINGQFDSEKKLYLQGGDELVETLGELDNTFTKVIQDFNKYKTTLSKIPKSGYEPSLQLREVLNYAEDGRTSSDITADNVDLWDFGKWASNVSNKIKETIYPIKEQLIVYDQDLNSLKEKVANDSVSVTKDIKPLDNLLSGLKEWDESPLPIDLFNLKISNLEYLSYLMETKGYKDSTSFKYQQQVVEGKLAGVKKIDSLANNLVGRNIALESLSYSRFVERQYSNAENLASFVKSYIDFAVEERKLKELELADLKDRMNWLIDEVDSIPVFMVEDTTKYSYQPVLIEENLTTGLRKNEKEETEGYFTQITPERTTQTKTYFKVNQNVFNFAQLKNIKSQVIDDGEGNIFYVLMYSINKESNSIVGNLSKIYSSDGLAWEQEIVLDTEPLGMEIDRANGDIIIHQDLDNYKGDASSIKSTVIVDKKGNPIEQ